MLNWELDLPFQVGNEWLDQGGNIANLSQILNWKLSCVEVELGKICCGRFCDDWGLVPGYAFPSS